MSENELTGSFEPDNTEGMLDDYNVLCDKLTSLNKISNQGNISRKTFSLIVEIQRRKLGFEKQFESLNMDYKKR